MDITVLVSSSPIKSHPSTEKIDQCIASVRERLPDSKIIIMQDGVRAEQQHLASAYQEYLQQLLIKYGDTCDIVIMSQHVHQARMTRECLGRVRTSLILYMEHDTGLCGDIPFAEMSDMILSDKANMIRLMFEDHILDEHQYLMRGAEGAYTRTVQWSQRPHLASTNFYDRLLLSSFSKESLTFIEDRVYRSFANASWEIGKLWIYTPEGDMRRSFTTNGREDAPKWDQNLVY